MTFKVADDGKGQLVLEHIGLDPSSVPTFVNKYQEPDVPVDPPVDPPVEPGAPQGPQVPGGTVDRPAWGNGHETLVNTGDGSYRAIAAIAAVGVCAAALGTILRARARKR